MDTPVATYTLYDGSEYSVLERPEGPDGALLMRWRLVKGAAAPPHIHPYTVESYEVLDGELDVLVDKEWRTLRQGDSASVQPGVRHAFRNRSDNDVVVRNVHDPHQRFEDYIRVIAQASQEARSANPNNPAAAIRLALVLDRHRDLIRLSDPPLKLLVPVLRGIGRILRMSPPS